MGLARRSEAVSTMVRRTPARRRNSAISATAGWEATIRRVPSRRASCQRRNAKPSTSHPATTAQAAAARSAADHFEATDGAGPRSGWIRLTAEPPLTTSAAITDGVVANRSTGPTAAVVIATDRPPPRIPKLGAVAVAKLPTMASFQSTSFSSGWRTHRVTIQTADRRIVLCTA